MSFATGRSDPQTGRLFFRSHGDCFIHATQWWIKYWNPSYTKDGLAIVRVTVSSSPEKVFLTTLCLAPIPDENVQRGVKRKQYLEIDPKFAQELRIHIGMDVLVESIGDVERGDSLVLAPVTSSDYDKLEKFSEKIDYELTERIRVVSCRHTFPIWIDNLVIPVGVVSSKPSANWIILIPNHTMVQLQRDDSVPPNSGISIMSTTSTPGQGSSSNGSPTPSASISSTLSLPPTQKTANRQWDFNNQHSKVMPRRKKSSSSNRSSNLSDSSVDTSSVDTSPVDDSDPFSSSISRFANYVGNWIFSREGSQVENEERPSQLESRKEDKASFSASLGSVGFETRCFPGNQSDNQIRLGKVADVLEESNPVTEQPLIETSSSPHNQIMNEIKHTVPRYTGPLYKGAGARPGAVTPDPPPKPSMSSESEPTDKTKKSYHKRFNTWHSDTDFNKRPSPGFRGGQRAVVPCMCVNLRVQPHPISGLCSFNSSVDSPPISGSGLWGQDKLFDIFVHPSTMPEIFLYWQNVCTESILVEITPTNPLPSDPKENKPTTTAPDEQTDAKQDARSISSSEASLVSLLPSSLVVRLCFATRIRLEDGQLITMIKDGCSTEDDEESDTQCVDFSVAVGHVVMSDTVRQQLRIRTCSPVTLQHVKDEWRISYNDRPNLVLQPLNPKHKHRGIEIKNLFEEWVKAVSHLSSIGAVLVDKQVVPVYMNEDGDWVYCRMKISAINTRRVPPRVRYLLATGQRLSLHIDSLPSSHNRPSFSKPVFSRRYRDTSPSKEEVVTLPAMTLLNQPNFNVHIEHFIALEQLYTEGVEYLETVFSQTGKGGALLVCGVSGAGGSGCGKTSLAKLLCKAVNGHPHHVNVTLVNCTALRGVHYKKKLKVHFSEAILHQPSVILLDDLDHTTPQVSDPQEQIGEEGNASIKKTQVLLDLFELVQQQEARVVLIATAQNKQQLNSDLLQSRGVHVFEKILEIKPPTLADRKVILSSILGSKSMNVLNDHELRAVALKTEGFQPGDLVTLVDKAISLCELRTLYPQGLAPLTPSSPVKTHLSPWIHASRTSTDGSSSDLDLSCTLPANSFMTPPSSPRKRHLMKSSDKQHNKKISTDSTHTLIQGESAFTVGRGLQHSSSLSQMKMGVNDFLRALRGFVPVALRGLPLHRSGTIDFSGVGGLKTVKKCLKETLLWPSKYPRLFGQCPIKQRCGVLLYGAPGTGKTFLAGAVAKEFNLNFVSIKGPELLSKYIGASEQAVRDVFTRALCAKPCILFFDEFDSLAPRRGHDNTGVTDRVVNQLLTQLDGVESLQGVYVLAASSRPDLIDPALLRPGRIDRSLLCDMPTQEERKEILESLSRDMSIASGVNLGEIASKTEGMTGADLKALLYSAQLQAAHETLTARQDSKETSLTQSLDVGLVPSTPDTSGRGSSIASVSTKRPLVFNFTEGGVRKSSQLSSSLESTASALQRRGSYLSLQRRRSTLTRDIASDNSMFNKKKGKGISIKQEQLFSALSQVQPSISKQELKKYYQIYGKFTGKTKTSMENVKPTATMA